MTNSVGMCVCSKSLQPCPTLCNSTDHSPPGSSVHGILQARILEWVAMPFSSGSSQPRGQTHVFATPWTAARQASLSFTAPGACSDSCPLSWWCHPIISSSVVPFSSCLQFFPASGSFPVSLLFASGGQSIGASVSATILPMTSVVTSVSRYTTDTINKIKKN